MRINVVDLDPAGPGGATQVEVADHFDKVDSVLWLPVPQGLDGARLDNVLADEAPKHVLRSDVTVLALHPGASDAPSEDSMLTDVHRRVEEAPLYVVRHEGTKPRLVHARGTAPRDVGERDGEFLRALREADIGAVVRRSGAELPKHDVLHYEGPNGDHYRAFLRAGFALRSTGDLDRCSFWLASLLSGCTSFLVDNWAMVALAYHLGAYLRRLGDVDAPVRVQSISRYDETTDELARRLELLFDEAPAGGLGLIMSVYSSGKLAERIRDAADRAGFGRPPLVAICDTPPHDGDVQSLVTLPEHFRRRPRGECDDCWEQADTVVPIQRDTYLLALAAYVRNESITKVDAQAGRKFVKKYARRGVVRVHRTHPDGRHHAFHLDVTRMLGAPAFRTSLRKSMSGWNGAGVQAVLCPPLPAAESLAGIVADELGVPLVVADEKKLEQVEAPKRDLLLHAEVLALVDDAVISGNRLKGYRNHLIQLRRRFGAKSEFDLHCLVAVARPSNERQLRGIRDMTHDTAAKPRFAAVETILLPHWSGPADCAWCAELALLRSLPEAVRAMPLIADRLERLERPDGLERDLYLPWSTSGMLPTAGRTEQDWPEQGEFDYWELNRESVFGDVQKADLALSVASAIQTLRNEPPRPGGGWEDARLDDVFRSPIAKVLHPHLYLTGRFYEPVIVAAILRAVRRHDLRAPTHERQLIEALHQLTTSSDSAELRSELLLAAHRGVLPAVFDPDMDTVDPPPAPGVRAMFAALRLQVAT